MNINLENLPSLLDESTFENTFYSRKDLKRRRDVLNDTISAIILNSDFLYQKAEANLKKWNKQRSIEDVFFKRRNYC